MPGGQRLGITNIDNAVTGPNVRLLPFAFRSASQSSFWECSCCVQI